ncbi:conjugative transposon protein TraM [Pedobacter jejuensis]|uniref:Conjugative transposon protein TraM n=1 Tax=Pedobacter jejuensis TaxID=1268550 RepID=A0A3N0BXY6_9SPHI|nr:conjugative transposon protein TraM [Pedobacter jejuensis]RNL54613.1 conjugative transposon protein TraM [Pedobacter jejuensis]
METRQKDHKKVLLFLPILVLPFLALAFYAMGGGKGNEDLQQTSRPGINTHLPDATFKKDEPVDKMGFYQQNDRDSANKNGIENVADRLGFKQEDDFQTKQINEKLEALNKEIAKPVETRSYQATNNISKSQSTSLKSDVDRLEALMKVMQDNKNEDPEMAQLSSMMDKIITIQNPQLVQEKLRTQQPYGADTAFKAISAVIEGNQKVAQGGVVKLRLLDTIHLKGVVIPKNQLLFGSCNITNQRLLLSIKNIRLGNAIIPVDLSVFSLDGMIGIDAPEAEISEAAGSGINDALQGMQILSMDQSLGIQAAGAGIDAAKSLLSKKAKRIRIKLKAGQQLLLRNNQIRTR